MLHSILIPHRNRLKRLQLCIWSIERSARICGIAPNEYEVIVADQASDGGTAALHATFHYIVRDIATIRVLRDPGGLATVDTPGGPVSVFSKPRALNHAIEAAQGEVLTFLDADAIVGSRWLEGAEWLASDKGADTTRLCYRVRYLPESTALEWTPCPESEAVLADCFRRYDDGDLFPRAHEAYLDPEVNAVCELQHGAVFGNSQFSIRRETLGELRGDEGYTGAGFEDLEFIRAISRQAGEAYKGVIRTDPEEAMFHIRNTREPGWGCDFLNQANRKRYLAT